MSSDKIKIANIGCRYYKSDPSKTGGVVVLFEQWLNFCSSINNITFTTIDSNKSNYPNKIFGLFTIIREIINFAIDKNYKKIIVLHSTYFDILVLAPIILILKKLFKYKFVIRKFAGNFDELYKNSNRITKSFLKLVISKADIVLWESNALVSFGGKMNSHSYWFPNVRFPSENHRNPERKYSYKFVFISRVEKEKGVLELVKCISDLGLPYYLDIYGPLKDINSNDLQSVNVSYKGTLSPENVSKTLCEYDVLCLPTYWDGEGYPGIIIEAFSAGLPVISTFKGGIPELIENNFNGFLIKPKDILDLRNAIIKFSEDNYYELSHNASQSFEEFDAEKINPKILRLIITN